MDEEVLTYLDLIPEDLIYELCLILKSNSNFPFVSESTLKVYLRYLRNLWKGYIFNFDPLLTNLYDFDFIKILPHINQYGIENVHITIDTDQNYIISPQYIEREIKKIYRHHLGITENIIGKLNDDTYIYMEYQRPTVMHLLSGHNNPSTFFYIVHSKSWNYLWTYQRIKIESKYKILQQQGYDEILKKLYKYFNLENYQYLPYQLLELVEIKL